MNRRKEIGKHILAACALLFACVFSAAQQNGYWRAASTNALAITSDIAISARSISINFDAFPLAEIRKLTPAEISAAFDADLNAEGSGSLYRLNIPAAKRFVKKSPLCGSEDTQWMAAYVTGKTLTVSFFSGADAPTLTFEALNNATNRCGTFTYAR
jgi:hypothetical protein